MLTPETTKIIKATTPAVAANAEAITQHFYPLMFRDYPEVKSFFNQSHQGDSLAQPRALANALVAYATHIDDLGVLAPAVEKIVQKHVSLDIQADQYNIIGTCLLQSIKAVLGDAATEEVITAWGEAYWQLANILIDAEETIYQQYEAQEGGWRGQREFVVTKKEKESDVITSFYLKPKEGSVPNYKAGQYIGLVLQLEGIEHDVRRNYSLSDAAGKEYLRISVKREQKGIASTHLHNNVHVGDSLTVLPPAGDFVLNDTQKPLVLITAGVGITPAISMLNTAASSGRTIHFVHAALNQKHHAFRAHVDQLAQQHQQIKATYFYSEPTDTCKADHTGFITQESLNTLLQGENKVEVYFLGPKPFMQQINRHLKALGIDEKNISYEFFGPLEALETA
ncbi:MAG: NO-inducible flavohemoprotein [Cocleimonas sp.]|nr:NO-inducible flavohemoprotein [Cocleimonas sp.]